MIVKVDIPFKCALCGNQKAEKFYVMPLSIKASKNDFYYSKKYFKVVCKLCNKTYLIDLNIKVRSL